MVQTTKKKSNERTVKLVKTKKWQGHLWPKWPWILSKDVDLSALFGSINNSFWPNI